MLKVENNFTEFSGVKIGGFKLEQSFHILAHFNATYSNRPGISTIKGQMFKKYKILVINMYLNVTFRAMISLLYLDRKCNDSVDYNNIQFKRISV